ncbi:hypothetical protein DFJ73DRAFT_117867 [Zopfochytrium polystomum]|nr:hypothetical protein DFJ73DRAFT_117867 [Zopfochytrium polystomum]
MQWLRKRATMTPLPLGAVFLQTESGRALDLVHLAAILENKLPDGKLHSGILDGLLSGRSLDPVSRYDITECVPFSSGCWSTTTTKELLFSGSDNLTIRSKRWWKEAERRLSFCSFENLEAVSLDKNKVISWGWHNCSLLAPGNGLLEKGLVVL